MSPRPPQYPPPPRAVPFPVPGKPAPPTPADRQFRRAGVAASAVVAVAMGLLVASWFVTDVDPVVTTAGDRETIAESPRAVWAHVWLAGGAGAIGVALFVLRPRAPWARVALAAGLVSSVGHLAAARNAAVRVVTISPDAVWAPEETVLPWLGSPRAFRFDEYTFVEPIYVRRRPALTAVPRGGGRGVSLDLGMGRVRHAAERDIATAQRAALNAINARMAEKAAREGREAVDRYLREHGAIPQR